MAKRDEALEHSLAEAVETTLHRRLADRHIPVVQTVSGPGRKCESYSLSGKALHVLSPNAVIGEVIQQITEKIFACIEEAEEKDRSVVVVTWSGKVASDADRSTDGYWNGAAGVELHFISERANGECPEEADRDEDQAHLVGVLAFGSLIWEPGCLAAYLKQDATIYVATPWPVEYARKSSSRGDAPTLVRVEKGDPVTGRLLVLNTADITLATRLIAYREGCHTTQIARCPELKEGVNDLAAVLYANLKANLGECEKTPAGLANLAIGSCHKLRGRADAGKNGIRYLYENIGCGVETGLTCEYSAAILERCQAETLKEAEDLCLAEECRSTDPPKGTQADA